MKFLITSIVMLIIGGVGTSLFLLWKRGNKVDYNPEDFKDKNELTEEEIQEVLEATYEVLEKEHEQDEEFANKVTKIGREAGEDS